MGSSGKTNRNSIRMITAQPDEQMGSLNICIHRREQMGSPKLSQFHPSLARKPPCDLLHAPSKAIKREKLARRTTSQIVVLVLGMGLSASPAIAAAKKVSILFSGRVPALCDHKNSRNQSERSSSLARRTLRTQKPIGSTGQRLTTCLVY